MRSYFKPKVSLDETNIPATVAAADRALRLIGEHQRAAAMTEEIDVESDPVRIRIVLRKYVSLQD